MIYGYSPFEVKFDKFGKPVCEEANYLKIINGLVFPINDRVNSITRDFIVSILKIDKGSRPYIQDIIKAIPGIQKQIANNKESVSVTML